MHLPAVQQRGRSRAGPRACSSAPEHLNLAVKGKVTSPDDKQMFRSSKMEQNKSEKNDGAKNTITE